MSKDYNEPWRNTVGIVDREGFPVEHSEKLQRAVACVNSCQGVPDEALKDRAMAKACLVWLLTELQKASPSREFQGLTNDNLIQAAIRWRKMGKNGCDFGELNALIDSFKEEA